MHFLCIEILGKTLYLSMDSALSCQNIYIHQKRWAGQFWNWGSNGVKGWTR